MPDSKSETYARELANDFLSFGLEKKALSILLPHIRAKNASVETLWLAAQISDSLCHYDIKIAALTQAINITPNTPKLYTELAEALIRSGQEEEARNILIDCIKKTDDLNAHSAIAFLDIRTGREANTNHPDDSYAFEAQDYVRLYLSIHNHLWNDAQNYAIQALDLPQNTMPSTEHIKKCAPTLIPIPPCLSKKPTFTIATSLSPKGGETQRRAMQSWAHSAERILSVNTEAEIKRLKPDYDFIDFVEAKRDASQAIGKPLIFIDDILESLETSNTDLCGIINADIFLLNEGILQQELLHAGAGALTIIQRNEIKDDDQVADEKYGMGFDAFFFSKNYIPHYKNSNLCLGAPWWDYLFPILSLQISQPCHIPTPPIIGHIEHPQNWSLMMHLTAARYWFEAILQKNINLHIANPAYNLFCEPTLQECYSIFDTKIPAIQNAKENADNLHKALYRLPAIIACLIRNTPLQVTPSRHQTDRAST